LQFTKQFVCDRIRGQDNKNMETTTADVKLIINTELKFKGYGT
jgi:hypothetical protein